MGRYSSSARLSPAATWLAEAGVGRIMAAWKAWMFMTRVYRSGLKNAWSTQEYTRTLVCALEFTF
ncbi:MAG: hypothetical protein AMXMBFR33_39450 [Candidatus Xenobia bacterium]